MSPTNHPAKRPRESRSYHHQPQKLPSDIVENAFRLKWESELIKDDFAAATATCLAFNRLYPESVLADQALMTSGRSLVDRKISSKRSVFMAVSYN